MVFQEFLVILVQDFLVFLVIAELAVIQVFQAFLGFQVIQE